MRKKALAACLSAPWIFLLVLTVLAASPNQLARAAPERAISITTTYTSLIAEKGRDISFPVDVSNKGTVDENIDLAVGSLPEGWTAYFKDRGFVIRKVYLLPGKSQSLTFQAAPPAEGKEGDYRLVLQASTDDNAARSSLPIVIGLRQQTVGGIKLSTLYPALRGPSGVTFEFKVDLQNKGDEDRTVNLAAVQPEGWQVSFRPAFEQKQISTLRVKAGETSGLDVQVQPPKQVAAGEYPIVVQAAAGGYTDAINLKVVLMGTYELGLSTPQGVLNTQATAGEESNLTIVLKNIGSADLQGLSLTSSKPQDWSIVYTPARVDRLAAGTQTEVNVAVRPFAQAIAGDYAVKLTASNPQASESLDLRVSVETPTLWGWVGIALVVLVVGGLLGIFSYYSRR